MIQKMEGYNVCLTVLYGFKILTAKSIYIDIFKTLVHIHQHFGGVLPPAIENGFYQNIGLIVINIGTNQLICFGMFNILNHVWALSLFLLSFEIFSMRFYFLRNVAPYLLVARV